MESEVDAFRIFCEKHAEVAASALTFSNEIVNTPYDPLANTCVENPSKKAPEGTRETRYSMTVREVAQAAAKKKSHSPSEIRQNFRIFIGQLSFSATETLHIALSCNNCQTRLARWSKYSSSKLEFQRSLQAQQFFSYLSSIVRRRKIEKKRSEAVLVGWVQEAPHLSKPPAHVAREEELQLINTAMRLVRETRVYQFEWNHATKLYLLPSKFVNEQFAADVDTPVSILLSRDLVWVMICKKKKLLEGTDTTKAAFVVPELLKQQTFPEKARHPQQELNREAQNLGERQTAHKKTADTTTVDTKINKIIKKPQQPKNILQRINDKNDETSKMIFELGKNVQHIDNKIGRYTALKTSEISNKNNNSLGFGVAGKAYEFKVPLKKNTVFDTENSREKQQKQSENDKLLKTTKIQDQKQKHSQSLKRNQNQPTSSQAVEKKRKLNEEMDDDFANALKTVYKIPVKKAPSIAANTVPITSSTNTLKTNQKQQDYQEDEENYPMEQEFGDDLNDAQQELEEVQQISKIQNSPPKVCLKEPIRLIDAPLQNKLNNFQTGIEETSGRLKALQEKKIPYPSLSNELHSSEQISKALQDKTKQETQRDDKFNQKQKREQDTTKQSIAQNRYNNQFRYNNENINKNQQLIKNIQVLEPKPLRDVGRGEQKYQAKQIAHQSNLMQSNGLYKQQKTASAFSKPQSSYQNQNIQKPRQAADDVPVASLSKLIGNQYLKREYEQSSSDKGAADDDYGGSDDAQSISSVEYANENEAFRSTSKLAYQRNQQEAKQFLKMPQQQDDQTKSRYIYDTDQYDEQEAVSTARKSPYHRQQNNQFQYTNQQVLKNQILHTQQLNQVQQHTNYQQQLQSDGTNRIPGFVPQSTLQNTKSLINSERAQPRSNVTQFQNRVAQIPSDSQFRNKLVPTTSYASNDYAQMQLQQSTNSARSMVYPGYNYAEQQQYEEEEEEEENGEEEQIIAPTHYTKQTFNQAMPQVQNQVPNARNYRQISPYQTKQNLQQINEQNENSQWNGQQQYQQQQKQQQQQQYQMQQQYQQQQQQYKRSQFEQEGRRSAQAPVVDASSYESLLVMKKQLDSYLKTLSVFKN